METQVLGISGFDTFTIRTTDGDIETESVILATGSKRAASSIPGIREYEGKGVSYCAICDAFFTGENRLQFWETVILPFMRQSS